MAFKKRSQAEIDRENYYNFHFGTSNKTRIDEINRTLLEEKKYLRIEYYLDEHGRWEEPKSANMMIYAILNQKKYIKHEKRKEHTPEGQLSSTEKLIFELDKTILKRQFAKKGYSKRQVDYMIDTLYKPTDINSIKSLKADDYTVDGNLHMMVLPEKMRYQNYLKKTDNRPIDSNNNDL